MYRKSQFLQGIKLSTHEILLASFEKDSISSKEFLLIFKEVGSIDNEGQKYTFPFDSIVRLPNSGISDKKRPKISCNPFIYYSFEQKTFR